MFIVVIHVLSSTARHGSFAVTELIWSNHCEEYRQKWIVQYDCHLKMTHSEYRLQQ